MFSIVFFIHPSVIIFPSFFKNYVISGFNFPKHLIISQKAKIIEDIRISILHAAIEAETFKID